MQETQTGVAKRRDHNYNLIKTSDDIPGLLIDSLNYLIVKPTTPLFATRQYALTIDGPIE